ncbi:MAG TPA: PIG-L family deacetylase [Rhodanobacteraceae bacterium]
MTRPLTFQASDRLMVFAPHPDDETIATGELIQLARDSGAAVRVVFATDGDNNPWPQRWCERRLRIGPADRARWGQRRRGEAEAALARLGIAADAVRFLGWPDLGVTGKLEHDDAAIDALRDEIAAWAPTHVAMPSLRDRHPDHGAFRVMLELALSKARSNAARLGYVVHGRDSDDDLLHLALDSARHARKREALMAHASQISLSKSRLLRWADQPEAFERSEAGGSIAGGSRGGIVLSLPLAPAFRYWRRHDVLLVIANGERIERARVPLPRFAGGSARVALGRALCAGRVAVELDGGMLQISIAGDAEGHVHGYVKLDRTMPRVVIFDVETWQRVGDFSASQAPSVEPMPVAHRASL